MRPFKPSAPTRSKKRKKNVLGHNAKPSTPPSPSDSKSSSLSIHDLKSLEDFCATFEFEDIDMTKWEVCDQALDLIVQIWASQEEIQNGAERVIEFVRTVRKTPEGASSREKVNISIRVRTENHGETRMVFQGQGDQCGGKSGDLIVIVNRKS